MDEFVTLGYLGTLGGCVGVVTLVTQVAKQYVDISPKWWVLIVSVTVVMIRQAVFVGDMSGYGIAEAGVNILICMAAASGLYEFTVKPAEKAIERKQHND